mgnify:CR=1 FL=1
MVSQGLLFSEPSIAETGVWCELSTGIDPAEWESLCRLRTMREKLVKIGAKIVRHALYVTFQMAEVIVSLSLFREILERIHHLKPVPIGSGYCLGFLKNLNF